MSPLALTVLGTLMLGAPPAVLDPGKDPSPLTWALPAGATGRFEVQLEKSVTQRMHPPPRPDGTKVPATEEIVVLPRMTFEVAATVTRHDGAGMELQFTATRPRFDAREGTEPGAGSALTVAFGGIAPMTWTVRLDVDGHVAETRMRADAFPASTVEVLQGLVESVSWAWVALPAEPVGVGGRFETQTNVRDGAFPVQVTTTVERQRDGLALTMTRAATGGVDVPNAPEGITARYEDAKTVVRGTLAHDALGWPVRVDLHAEASVVTRGTSGGQPFHIESSEKRDVRIRR